MLRDEKKGSEGLLRSDKFDAAMSWEFGATFDAPVSYIKFATFNLGCSMFRGEYTMRSGRVGSLDLKKSRCASQANVKINKLTLWSLHRKFNKSRQKIYKYIHM